MKRYIIEEVESREGSCELCMFEYIDNCHEKRLAPCTHRSDGKEIIFVLEEEEIKK